MPRKPLFLLVFIALLIGCRQSPSPSPHSAAQQKTFTIRGKVISTDATHVTLDGEDVPGFMEAMTMAYKLKDPSVVSELHPGDRITAKVLADKDGDDYTNVRLDDIVVVAQAKPDYKPDKLYNGPTPGQAVPDFTMTTQEGKLVKLSDLRGSVVVLTFIYTRCPLPDFCPLMDRKFSELAQRIGAIPERARQIRLISLSFDPEHDKPEVLAKHAKIRGAAPPLWSFAVASHPELAKIAGPLGLFYDPRTNEIAHNLCTAIIDREGKLARLELGTARNKWENVDLLKTIYSLIPPAG